MGLLSTMEVAEACQKQHNAYMRAIDRPDLVVEWDDLDMESKLATERVVINLLEGKTELLKPPSALKDVPKIMKVSFSLFKQTSAGHPLAYYHTQQSKRQISGKTDYWHFKKIKLLYIGNMIDPAQNAEIVPPLPKQTADKSRKCRTDHKSPIA